MSVLGADADDADRGHEDRRRQLHAEQLDRQVPLGTIDHHPRDKAPLPERRHIEILRPLIAAAPLDVRDERLGPGLDGPLFERRDIDGQFGNNAVQAG